MNTYHIISYQKIRLFFIAAVIWLLPFGVHAQFTLNTSIDEGTFSDPESITLGPGFSSSPQGTQSLVLSINTPDCVLLGLLPSHSKNFIITYVPRKPNIPNVANSELSTCDLMASVQYMDGLGRPIQNVQVKASPIGSDIVQPIVYDQHNRQIQKYLPYALTSIANNNGRFNNTAIASQAAFYNPSGSSGTQLENGIARNTSPYSGTAFEPSPLNRVIEQGAPGDPWQLTGTTGLSATPGHTVKTDYLANTTGEVALWEASYAGGAVTSSSYAAGTLYKTVSKDENWVSGKTGTTEEFKDIEGHVVLKRVWQDESTGLNTYYIYNDLDSLAYVLPPAVTASSFSEGDNTFNNYIYAYHYDARQRLTEKKIPGKGWEYIAYNLYNQPVATQNAREHAANEWEITKYDEQGRVIITGLWNAGSSLSISAMETNIAGAAQADARNDASTTTGYDINSYPTVLDTILTINYYDDYTFPGAGTYASTATGISVQTKGLHTGSKVNVLNTGTMLLTENYYDSEGRLRESIAQNNIGGYDRTVNDYNFNNQLVQSVRTHNSATVSNLVVTNQFVYDHMGRKTHTLQQTGTGQPMVVISKEDYNEIGQLKAKHLHGTINGSDTTYLQDVKYTYNERGWLSSANAPLFAEQLQYNSGTTPQYNGNISQMNYSGPNSGSKVFNYAYDPLNRLTAATSTSNALNESMSYDAMGNITALTRTGARSATLAYTYTGNQLQSVTNSGSAFRSYTYDANGNATGDTTGRTISYNMLNLPQSVVKSGTTVATYTYDADGQKLKNTGTDGSWDYDAGIVYHNGALDFISTEVGRITTNGSNYTYQYNLPDHLGNNRVSFYSNSGAASLLQEDEYYSFGLRKSLYDNSNNNRYLYNGKEVQTDLKDQYDYGARFYDPVIGRFGTIDRYAEKYDALTPYQYGGLNPVSTIDMNGDSIEIIYDHQAILYERGELYGTDGKKYTGNGAKIGKDGNVSGYKGFLGETKKALDQIGSGKNGNELLSNIENAKDIAYIRESGDGSQTNGLIIKWDPYNREGGPDEFGAQDRDPFLSLGHELAHFLDGINGTLDRTTWYTTSTGTQIPNAEKYSTWWENRIRAEHGMNLREYYGIDNGKNVGRILIPFTNHLGGASTVNSIPVGPIFIPYFYSKQTP